MWELPFEDRVPIYRSHLESSPNDAAIWFDLGIAHKHLHQWEACIEANERALAISRSVEDPAWWNLGIAATAMRDRARARRGWRGYGLKIEGDDGPIDCKLGMAPVRLPHGEVVWGDRIDPARVILRNVPLPGSDYRWGDVVLHDGAPNGERRSNGRTYAVFDVFEKWSPSEIPTYQVDVTCASEDDSSELVDIFERNHFAAEDWSASVRYLCEACSTGSPGEHNHPVGTTDIERSFGLASPLHLAERLLTEWAEAKPGRAFDGLRIVSSIAPDGDLD